MKQKTIRIGTRDSELALWQARTVQSRLERFGFSCKLVPVKSTGDLELDTPLYEMGITGIFTKTLDIALLNNTIDIAVHSMKDVPTALPKGIVEAAILPRASSKDILIHKGINFLVNKNDGIIATGSLRRKAQWLHKYPHHTICDLRGNINTRMQKLKTHDWNAAIFAEAGLERINIKPDNFLSLDWMIPAPAQGAMLVVAREKDFHLFEACSRLNDINTQICVKIEREFLRVLEGGCSAPIGALAVIDDGIIHFKGNIVSIDGSQKVDIETKIHINNAEEFGKRCAFEILEKGGDTLMNQIKEASN